MLKTKFKRQQRQIDFIQRFVIKKKNNSIFYCHYFFIMASYILLIGYRHPYFIYPIANIRKY
jgi:hypothetical protein